MCSRRPSTRRSYLMRRRCHPLGRVPPLAWRRSQFAGIERRVKPAPDTRARSERLHQCKHDNSHDECKRGQFLAAGALESPRAVCVYVPACVSLPASTRDVLARGALVGRRPPEDSDTVSASDDVPPIPPPAPMRGGSSFIPPPLSPSSPAFAPRGTATPPVPQFHPYGAYIASTPWGGGPSPRERERERRLRFASPPRSWYAPPPPPVPVPALSPPFYAPPVPPVRPSPGMAPGMGLGTPGMPGMGMGATPVPWYMQSSPAPVIPARGAAVGGVVYSGGKVCICGRDGCV